MTKAFNYRGFFTKERRKSLFIGLILFVLAIIFQFYASAYSTRVSSNFVHDIFLDNLPVVDLSGIIVEGALGVIAGSMILIASKPKYIIFALKVTALFIAIRAMFIALTHLGIYPGTLAPEPGFFDNLYNDFGLSAGYFFSGHTGLPFLLALVFWNERFWRNTFFVISLIFGVSVILAHIHYSIDVFAAPFITYTIFRMGQYLFSEDYKLIHAPNFD